MRIVGRKEFMQLPSGTLFCQCANRWAIDDLQVKFDSMIFSDDCDDFVSMPFTCFEADSSEQWIDRIEAMANEGASFPLDLDAAGRDGLFNRDALFLVFETQDVVNLRDFLTSIIPTE